MSSLSRLFAAVVTLSLIGLACATSGSSSKEASSTVEDVPTESTPTEKTQVQLQKITAPEGFTVLFPGQVEAQRGKVSIPGGEVQTASWAINDSSGVLYSVSTLDYPEKVVAAHPAAAFFNEGKTGLVNKLKGTIKSEEDITIQGYPGKSLVISSDSGEVRAHNFLVGPRLYTLLVLFNPSIGAPQADQFFSSLELINPPPSISPAPKTTTSTDGGMGMGDGGMGMGDGGMGMGDGGTSTADGGTRRK